jgi:hypothetical protein
VLLTRAPPGSDAGAAAAGGDGVTGALPTTEGAICALFRELDTEGTGRVPLAMLLHVLAEVSSPTALSVEEVQELLRFTGVLNPATAADPRSLYAMEVDYAAFIRHLAFAPPR